MTELSLFGSVFGHECHDYGEDIWGYLLYPLFMLYMFYLLAQLCDGHLTTALEFIVERLQMSEDVAGATFLAMASSAPELFCSIISTFVLVSASGVGNIVGSAVFNLLVIIGVIPVFAGRDSLKIWWYPTARDASFYGLAIIEIFIFMNDGKVYWYESLIMCLSYASYVLYFTQNQRICKHFGLEPPKQNEKGDAAPKVAKDGETPPIRRAGTGETDGDAESNSIYSVEQKEEKTESQERSRSNERSLSKASRLSKASSGEGSRNVGAVSAPKLAAVVPAPAETDAAVEKEGDDEEEPGMCRYEPVMFVIDKIMPTKPEKLYTLFALTCVWICFLTYFAVDAADRLGCICGIPDIVMGLVILAAGTSVPDAMGSIAVAKDGMGDMAVANAVGSNTFDILLGLGLPWFLKSVVTQEPIVVLKSLEEQQKLREAVVILAGCLAFYLVIIVANKWTLTRNLGFVLIALYVCVITWFLLRAFDVFDM